MMRSINFNNSKMIVGIWLLILTSMVYLIIIIGGLTRLTDSGLSMVDWRPIMGIIPPISYQSWMNVFVQYQQTPEYLIINKNISLNEFKYIFWWEYSHRIFARIIGFVFLIPFIYFLLKKYLSKKTIMQLTFVFIFGLIQAVVGWWMVKSGLNNDPYVSQYRLAFHLGNAIIILGILFWMTLENLLPKNNLSRINVVGKNLIFFSLILCFITIISGSLVSGTDAGKSFNTFPLMNEKFFPDGYLLEKNFLLNLFENTIAIQFNHRWLAIFSFLFISFSALYTLKFSKTNLHKISSYLICFFAFFQVIIGIFTLIYNVPILLASLHQANASLLFCSIIFTFYIYSNKIK